LLFCSLIVSFVAFFSSISVDVSQFYALFGFVQFGSKLDKRLQGHREAREPPVAWSVLMCSCSCISCFSPPFPLGLSPWSLPLYLSIV
jgi:hypothetical protein